MAEICIFYSKEDFSKVKFIGSFLRELGWDAWWFDYSKPGEWSSLVQENLQGAQCVIPVWSSTSVKPEKTVINEAIFAKDKNIPIFQVKLDNVTLPIQFNLENTTDLRKWNGENPKESLKDLINKLIQHMTPQNKWNGERKLSIEVFDNQLKLPCFVKSLSSHETQLSPEQGIFALSIFPQVDAMLISAYDMYQSKDDADLHKYYVDKLKELKTRDVIIFLDSGNYESTRKDDKKWSKECFNWALNNIPYTYAFCFDNLAPPEDPVKNAKDVISRIEGEFEDKLIPIIHAPLDENEERIHEILPRVFYEYASRKKSPIIAVPERELGEGIRNKVKTVIKIRKGLNSLGFYQPIHLLGTGNPLTISLLSIAGADLFDGLEWCRTVADKTTGFLFHHQQFDLFKNQTVKNSRFPLVKEFVEGDDARLSLKLALHNLDFFIEWMETLQVHIEKNNVREMIKDRAVFGTHDFIENLKDIVPELFE